METKVDLHLLGFNEQDILPYTFRHYATFCSRMVLHDGGSTDRSREIAASFGAEVKDFITDGVNDALFKRLKETCWKGTDADWVIVADADELIYFPEGAEGTLAEYDDEGVEVVKPKGFEMFSDTFPTTTGQIYEEVVMGAPELVWYSKPILFSPRRIRSIEFSAGAHSCTFVDHRGYPRTENHRPTKPPTYLLHFHHLGGLERVSRRYAGQQSRHSQTNIKNRWGNFDPPDKHARDKRNLIVPNLVKVIP